jgi:hypothetical protein
MTYPSEPDCAQLHDLGSIEAMHVTHIPKAFYFMNSPKTPAYNMSNRNSIYFKPFSNHYSSKLPFKYFSLKSTLPKRTAIQTNTYLHIQYAQTQRQVVCRAV